MSKLKGWKTLTINVAVFVVMLGGALTGQITDPDTIRIVALATTVANVVMRFFTDTGVGKAE